MQLGNVVPIIITWGICRQIPSTKTSGKVGTQMPVFTNSVSDVEMINRLSMDSVLKDLT